MASLWVLDARPHFRFGCVVFVQWPQTLGSSSEDPARSSFVLGLVGVFGCFDMALFWLTLASFGLPWVKQVCVV